MNERLLPGTRDDDDPHGRVRAERLDAEGRRDEAEHRLDPNIGARTQIGPAVQIYAADPPRDAATRRGVSCHEIGVVEPGPAGRIVVDGRFA